MNDKKFINDILGLYFIDADGKTGYVSGKLLSKDMYFVTMRDYEEFKIMGIKLLNLEELIHSKTFFTNSRSLIAYSHHNSKECGDE